MTLDIPSDLEAQLKAAATADGFGSVDALVAAAAKRYLDARKEAVSLRKLLEEGSDELARGDWLEGSESRRLLKDHSTALREGRR